MKPTKIFLSINRPSVDLRVFQAGGSYFRPTHGRKRYRLMRDSSCHKTRQESAAAFTCPVLDPNPLTPATLRPLLMGRCPHQLSAGPAPSGSVLSPEPEACNMACRGFCKPLSLGDLFLYGWCLVVLLTSRGSPSLLLCVVFVLSTRKSYRISGHYESTESSSPIPSF